MNFRAIVTKDGKPIVTLGPGVCRVVTAERRERAAAARVDAAIQSAFDGEINIAELRLALRYAERRMGTR